MRCGWPADIGVDRDRHDFRPLGAFAVEPLEAVDAALREIGRFMMLDEHHRDVVELDRVGQGDERAVRGADFRRLVVIDPVADVFDAGGGEQVRRVLGLGQARPEPADRPLAGEPLEHAERALDHRRLILDLVDRHLLLGVAHELPAGVARLPRDPLVFLAHPSIDRQGRADRRAARTARKSATRRPACRIRAKPSSARPAAAPGRSAPAAPAAPSAARCPRIRG